MKKRILAMLLSGLLLLSATACQTVPENEIDEPAEGEVTTPNAENNHIPLNAENSSMRAQLEGILARKCTWEEFKGRYPNCRKADEFINGEYSYFRVVCEEFPETFFCFSLVVGENGFSEIQLESISARLEVVLPEYVKMSFDDIIAVEGDRAGFTYADEMYQEAYGYKYDTLHIYRDDFFYETTAYLQQGNVLQEYRIVMRRYSGNNLCPWDKDMDLSVNPNASLAENIEGIVATRCSLETFQKNYPNAEILEETEALVTVMTTAFPQVKFVFEKAVDAWIGFERTVLEKAVIDASVVFPEYVGMKQWELIECGFEFENRAVRDEHYLFLYKETVLYIVDLGMTSASGSIDGLQSDADIYVYPYSEHWVRPW